MMVAGRVDASRLAAAVCVAGLASVALFVVLMLDGGVALAQTEGGQTEGVPAESTATGVASVPVVVLETEIPEDWPAGQVDHIIYTFEAMSPDDRVLSFALRETDDSAKFSLIPSGVNDPGHYLAKLVLREGEGLDYETQDTYLIGVVVAAAGGASTEMLLRLRITDVDEDVVSPTPIASASPTPVTTPSDPCFEVITGEVNIVRSWSDACLSVNRPGDGRSGDYYARFFAFTITEAATVGIRLESDVDTYLYLMRGTEKGGEVVAENDDAVPGIDLNAEIVGKELEAGEYTIEATTYGAGQSGGFTLEVIGLQGAEEPDEEEPDADCSTGGAVVDAGDNRELVADCETLLGLRDALAGGLVLNWGADIAIGDWDGVSVGGSPMRVTGLELDEVGLSGRLPAELEMLSGLGVLSLSGNRLRGAVPPELGSLSNLTRLSINNNLLSGEIPVALRNLAALETLALNDNRLSGVIPPDLADLAGLKSLLLANNRLSGEIPEELAELGDLEVLTLAGNSLSGCIPPALLDVPDNDLSRTGLEACASGICVSGSAVDSPHENVGLVADCNALIASRSRLGGRVSLNWSVNVPIEDWEGVKVGGSPKRVIHLVLNERGLSGRLPAELGRLSHLSLLQITGNEIKGTIPAELGSLSRLQLMVLANNDLSGEIPPELDGLSSLSHMSLSGNQLSGEIPPELSSLSNLSSLYLDDNGLSGDLPKEFGSLPKLRFLYLDDNDLSGKLPPELGDSTTLEVLAIDGNRLTGPIPREFGGMTSLEHLSLESNMLSGDIPAELGSLTNLEILSLAANRLTGEIPAQLGAIPNLRTLSLHSNGFTGCIPRELQDVQRNDLISLGLEFCGEGQCAGGTAVANPNANHGLVSDCNWLLAGLDGLRGAAALNWATELAIENWEGITISGSPRRITEVNLDNSGLDGEIPDEVRNLTYLRVLNLSDNSLSGEIPSELARLSSLEVLSLNDNQLSGQIPHNLTRLDNLTELNLSGNPFSGCIPDGLDDITDNDLDALVNLPLCGEVDCSSGSAVEDPDDNQELVSDCEILMELRDELAGGAFLNWSVHLSLDDWEGVTVGGSIERVTHIELNGKGLSGELPAELARLEALEVLALSDNELVGRIPSELGKLTNLKRLLLDGNLLNGEISPELGVLSDLEELKLAGNNLSGCVPKTFDEIMTNDLDELGLGFCEVGECSNGTAVEDPDDNPGLLTDCDALLAARDKLRGAGFLNWSADVAVDEWHGVTVEGSPKRVTQLKIRSWRLDGEIPAELGRLSKLRVLSLADNRLSGEIPSELGDLHKLEELSLSRNRLDGAIPSQLGNLTSLERLSLSDNRLSGELPSELGQLVNLDHLSLSNNRLTGEIPAEFGMLTELTYLSLTNNRVTGAIPAEIGNLTELRYLRLSDNSLSGAIPSEFGGLVQLRHLHLSRNQLTGAIPAELGSLSSLTLLHLSDNGLSGVIPTELGSLSNLTELYLSRNGKTGGIPSELGNLAKLAQLYLPRNELTGEIPVELDTLEHLAFLFVGGNQLMGCIPSGLKDVAHNDLSLLNLPDCETETSMFLDPREPYRGFEGVSGGASNSRIYLDGLVGLRRPL